MEENYIFSGFGYAVGEHCITNQQLEHATKTNYLKGFSEEKLLTSENYKKYCLSHPGATPFEYFTEHKMGFKTRCHVIPFPPTHKKLTHAETSLDLAVRAVNKSLEDGGIHPGEIDAWFVSTVSPHEQAPGLGATLKCFFVPYDNQKPAFTISSGCSGFVLNLQRALEYMKCNENVKNVMIVHTETMSAFLRNLTHYVPFVTFGDAASAIILTKQNSKTKEGLIDIENFQDMAMIDAVGVDKEWNLYMTDAAVKDTAIKHIVSSSELILKRTGWNANDVDILIPHQTGNAILHEAAKKINFPLNKLFQEVQKEFGNISGASIPLSFSYLHEKEKLSKGTKVLTATAGVGGTYGAFTYIVPENKIKKHWNKEKDLQNCKALITGSTGGLGEYICFELAKRGCNLILQYNSNDKKADELKNKLLALKINVDLIKANFTNKNEVDQLINFIKTTVGKIDFLVLNSAVTGSLSRASEVTFKEVEMVNMVNHFMPAEITKQLKKHITKTILYIGSVAEDAQFSGTSAYVSAKRALHGFAASYSWEAFNAGVRSIYYMPGMIDTGMAYKLDAKQRDAAMLSTNQEKILNPVDVAERIVQSLYLPKVLKVKDCYENILIVRKDGYII